MMLLNGEKRNVEEGKEEKGREMKGCFITLQN